MFCGNCGTELDESMDFCPNCGNKVNSGEKSAHVANVAVTNAAPRTIDNGWSNINVYALFGFILAFVLGIPGLVLSIMGLDESHGGRNKNLAIAGIVVSIINIIVTIILGIAFGMAINDYGKKSTYPF